MCFVVFGKLYVRTFIELSAIWFQLAILCQRPFYEQKLTWFLRKFRKRDPFWRAINLQRRILAFDFVFQTGISFILVRFSNMQIGWYVQSQIDQFSIHRCTFSIMVLVLCFTEIWKIWHIFSYLKSNEYLVRDILTKYNFRVYRLERWFKFFSMPQPVPDSRKDSRR